MVTYLWDLPTTSDNIVSDFIEVWNPSEWIFPICHSIRQHGSEETVESDPSEIKCFLIIKRLFPIYLGEFRDANADITETKDPTNNRTIILYRYMSTRRSASFSSHNRLVFISYQLQHLRISRNFNFLSKSISKHQIWRSLISPIHHLYNPLW